MSEATQNRAASESVAADPSEQKCPVETSEVRSKVPAPNREEVGGLSSGRHQPRDPQETLQQTPMKDPDVQSSGRPEDVEDVQSSGRPAEMDGETPAAESQWEVGSPCRAVWSKDGRVYPATVLCLDGGRCRIRFKVYGNEEDVDLSALRRPAPPTRSQDPRVWAPGSRCRAVYSQDGRLYPAVVLWVKGQRCRVRFDSYNNEEEQEVSGLLSREDPRGRVLRKGGSWKKKEDQPHVSEAEEKLAPRDKETQETPTNGSSRLFPAFPAQLLPGEPLALAPPPPPWTLGEKESGHVTSNMLTLWYMCGFHTGSYMARHGVGSAPKD